MKAMEAYPSSAIASPHLFSPVAVRGKYYQDYNEGHNLVLLTPEVAKAFPSEDAVNKALLSLIKIAQA